jgi:hypothetical protein
MTMIIRAAGQRASDLSSFSFSFSLNLWQGPAALILTLDPCPLLAVERVLRFFPVLDLESRFYCC